MEVMGLTRMGAPTTLVREIDETGSLVTGEVQSSLSFTHVPDCFRHDAVNFCAGAWSARSSPRKESFHRMIWVLDH